MSGYALLTILVVGGMLLMLVMDLLEADIVAFSALAVLLLAGVLTPKEAFEGFANKGLVTIALLFIVAYAAQQSGILESFTGRVMGSGKGERSSLLRMMTSLVASSAFINNTPLVAMLTPSIRSWAVRNSRAPSRFLIPMTYAVSFGGVCTLIGTSTNLVVNGLLQKSAGTSLAMFDLTWVGLPCALIGTLFVALFAYRLLPARRDLADDLSSFGREYLLEMRILEWSPLVGKTVEEAGLRNLEQLFLVEIEREGESLVPVKPTDHLRAGDRLVFSGVVNGIIQLQKLPGLVPFHDGDFLEHLRAKHLGRIIEAVVSPSSPMVGKTIKEGSFRGRYGAAVVAVHRHGERINAKIGQITLKAGDTLLLLAGDDFLKTWNHSSDFYLVSKITDIPLVDRRKSFITITALLLMVALSAFGVLEIFYGAILAALILLLSRCVTAAEARSALEINVLIVIACSFGISTAIEKTGVAAWFAAAIVGTVSSAGGLGALAAVFLATTLLTEAITNNAAAAIVFPIAMATAARLGADPKPFAVAVAIAASASFATTIGYQTNLMVSGPGRYSASDFLKIGIPVKMIYSLCALIAIAAVWRIR